MDIYVKVFVYATNGLKCLVKLLSTNKSVVCEVFNLSEYKYLLDLVLTKRHTGRVLQ